MRKNSFFALAFGLLVCFAILISVELFYAFIDRNTVPDQTYSSRVTYMDPDGITRARPSETYRVTKRSRITGSLIYDTTYSVDSLSRRITPVENPENRNNHLLFLDVLMFMAKG